MGTNLKFHGRNAIRCTLRHCFAGTASDNNLLVLVVPKEVI